MVLDAYLSTMGVYPSHRQQGNEKDEHCIEFQLEEARILGYQVGRLVFYEESLDIQHFMFFLFDRAAK
jgi:hypothetical protein